MNVHYNIPQLNVEVQFNSVNDKQNALILTSKKLEPANMLHFGLKK